jgi:ubiquinone biosynthesis accessory factor UbiK
MIQPDKVETFVQQASKFLPSGFDQAKIDFEQNIKQSLMHLLDELNLVSKEEFDIQRKILQRSREKLSALEKRLDQLENQEK